MGSSAGNIGDPQPQSDELHRLLCNRWAYRLLSAAAAAQIIAVVLLVLLLSPAFAAFGSLRTGPMEFSLLTWMTVAVFVSSSLTTTLGMLGYLLEVDPKSRKMPWMLAFLITGGVGSAIYCLSVYRKQQAL